jgi:hypothetical protein
VAYDRFRWKCHTLQKIIFPLSVATGSDTWQNRLFSVDTWRNRLFSNNQCSKIIDFATCRPGGDRKREYYFLEGMTFPAETVIIWINRVCLHYEYVYMCELWCSDCYIMPRLTVWRFVSSQCQQLFCNGSCSRTIIYDRS